jgi:hypothetical protein
MVNEKKFLTVLANNRPEMVLCSLDFFNNLMEMLDKLEFLEIKKQVEEAHTNNKKIGLDEFLNSVDCVESKV